MQEKNNLFSYNLQIYIIYFFVFVVFLKNYMAVHHTLTQLRLRLVEGLHITARIHTVKFLSGFAFLSHSLIFCVTDPVGINL